MSTDDRGWIQGDNIGIPENRGKERETEIQENGEQPFNKKKNVL